MKTFQSTNTVETSGVASQTSFSIKANGKAFRSLIDNVYTDKVTTPIRELMTNAFDAHVAAGKADKPFSVIVPTAADPRFGVRDFGTGMDHDTVTGLYTTLFDSSKDDTNDQVGQLGLGSKSPFAYTDTFTVTAFDGRTKRTYTAFMSDDLPQLALLHEGRSPEPRGILVEFPVADRDRQDFKEKIAKVAMGFDVMPQFIGSQINVEDPVSEGDGWRTYRSGWSHPFRNDGLYVRQGCVIYPVPVSNKDIFPLSYGTAIVIDIPIGTAQVALSREALSWDKQTEENVLSVARDTWSRTSASLKAQYDARPRLIDKLRFRNESIPEAWWRSIDGVSTKTEISLRDTEDPGKFGELVEKKTPGYVVYAANPAKSYGVKYTTYSTCEVKALQNLQVVLMDDVTPRRKGRVLAWGRDWDTNAGNRSRIPMRVYLPVEGQDKAVKRLKQVWDLKDHQFIPVSTLPDVQRATRGSGGTGPSPTSKDVIADLQAKLDAGALWVQTHHGTHQYANEAIASGMVKAQNRWDTPVRSVWDAVPNTATKVVADSPADEVVEINKAQYEILNPDPRNELSVRIAAVLEAGYDEYVNATVASVVRSELVRSVGDRRLGEALATKLGISHASSNMDVRWYAGRKGDLYRLSDEAEKYGELATKATLAFARKHFPQVFPHTLEEQLDYINRQAAQLHEEEA